jgi:hypothetical protein
VTIGLLISRQRSGTGALGSVLDQHPQVAYLGEVLHNDSVDKLPNYFAFLHSELAANPRAYLPSQRVATFDRYMAFLEQYTPKPIKFLDVKYNSTHHLNGFWHSISDPPILIERAKHLRLPVIHLVRKNLLRAFISGKLAEANKVWHATRTDEITIIKMAIVSHQLTNYIRTGTEEINLIAEFLARCERLLCLEYSLLFDQHGILPRTALQLQDFLGIDEITLIKPNFVKQVEGRLEDIIENYDEIYRLLIRTPHSWMLFSS